MLQLAKGLGAALQVLSSLASSFMEWVGVQRIKNQIRKDEALEQDARFSKAKELAAKEETKVQIELAKVQGLSVEEKEKELAARFNSPTLQ
jgi:uncharacterized sporulation protein YeaH/YhbH (DUF444 family)